MRYTRSNFKKWLQKMPPDSRPFGHGGKRLRFVKGYYRNAAGRQRIRWGFTDDLCPISQFLGLEWSFQALDHDKELAEAIDRDCKEKYTKLTPRKILSIIKRLEK